MQRQGYKNAASNKVTRAKKELLSHQSPARSPSSPKPFTLAGLILGAQICPSIRPRALKPHSSYLTYYYSLPLTLHDIRLLPGPFFLHYPTASLRSTRPSAFSPLVTILALHHTHRPSSQGPDRTLPYLPHPFQKTTAKQDVVAHCLQRLCLYRLLHCAVAVPG